MAWVFLVTQTRIQLPWNAQKGKKKKKGGGSQTYCYDGTSKEKKKETLGEGGTRVHGIYPEIGGFPNHTQSACAVPGNKSTMLGETIVDVPLFE